MLYSVKLFSFLLDTKVVHIYVTMQARKKEKVYSFCITISLGGFRRKV